MPPPATIPQRRAQSSLSRQQPVQTSPPELSQVNESGAFPIAVLPRTSSRPPIIQSSPARLLPPHRPSVEPFSSPSPISVPLRDARALSVPNKTPAVPSTVTTSMTPVPSAAPVLAPPPPTVPSRTGPPPEPQIDPALMAAVVTALRQADQSQSFASPSPGTEDPRGVQPDARSDESVPTAAPPADALSTQGQVSAPTTHAKRPSARRPTRNTEDEPSDGAQGAPESTDAITATEGEAYASDEEPTQKRRRKSSGTQRKRRSRAPSLPPYDPCADPGEELDPTAVTMAELCEDTGRGRVSSKAAMIMNNHAAWRAANREKRARMRARMEAQKYGRNADDEENADNADGKAGATGTEQEGENPDTGPVRVASGNVSRAQSAEPLGEKGDGFDYTQAMSTSRYNVQVRIGPNGETIIDEASLFVDRHAEEDTAEYTHIEESDTTKFVNSATYSKKLRGSRWSTEETELFYDVCRCLPFHCSSLTLSFRRCPSSARTMNLFLSCYREGIARRVRTSSKRRTSETQLVSRSASKTGGRMVRELWTNVS